MGANAISRHQTQPDPLRMFAEVKGSPFDSIRPRQTVQTALNFPDTEEATSSNLVPPTGFSNVCLAMRAKMRARRGAGS
jgi:hypothetical protein